MPTLREALAALQPHMDQALLIGERGQEQALRNIRRRLREAVDLRPIVSPREAAEEDHGVTIPEDAFERARQACREIGIEL